MVLRTFASCSVFVLLFAAGAGTGANRPRGTPAHAAALGGSTLVPAGGDLPDPVSIQRVFLPVDRVDTLKPEVARGTLKALPKIEFEAKIQAAARVVASAQTPARILEAAYKATVQSGRVGGVADWKLGHPTSGASAMVVDPLPGAMQSPKWADGKPPLLFRSAPDGKALAATHLWVEGPSQTDFSFQWSARLEEQPDNDRCTLTFPPATIATLELTLAAERVPVVNQMGVLLTGPFPSSKSEDRIWKFAFGEQNHLDLAFRKAQPSDEVEQAVRVDCAASWKLLRTEISGRIDFTLESIRPGNRQRVFQVDAAMEILNVVGATVESWRWAPDGSQPRQLSVRFRDEGTTTRFAITVRAETPLAATSWVPPRVRLPNSILLGDSIDVRLAAEWKLEGWQTGDYRLGTTTTGSDRSTQLEFLPALVYGAERLERQPPAIRIRPADREFSTVETLDWRLEPSRTRLTATYATRVIRGPIPSFTFQAASGYSLESVALTPDDPGMVFGAQPGSANGWFVEPSRAVGTGQSLEIRLQFRALEMPSPSNLSHADAGKLVPLPKVFPVGSSDRKGVLAVRPSPGIKLSTTGMSLPQTPLTGEPGFSVAYRGREPEGDVLVTRAPPVIAAKFDIELNASAPTLRVATTLHGRVDGTSIQTILVWVPGTGSSWHIEPAGTASPVPGQAVLPWLPALGGANRWEALALAGLLRPSPGTLWRIAFAKPLSGEFSCRTVMDLPRSQPDVIPSEVPLPHFFGVPTSETTVKLDPKLGLTYRAFVSRASVGSRPYVALMPKEVSTPPREDTPAGQWVFRGVQMESRIDADGVKSTLRGTVVQVGGRRLPIALSGGQLESAMVDGKHLALTASELAETGIPISHPGAEFEVRYTRHLRPRVGGMLLGAEPLANPLPGEPEIAHAWSLDSDLSAWPSLATGAVPEVGGHPVVVRASLIRAGSLVIAVLIALSVSVGYMLGRNRAGLTLAVSAVIVSGIACWLAPDGWSAAARMPLAAAFGCIVPALWFKPTRVVAPLSAMRHSIAALALAVLASGGSGQAQAPEAAKVYVLAGPTENPDQFKVLVPKSVLEKLEVLARSPLPDLVILSAEYDCLAAGDTVDVQAKYLIHSQKAFEQSLMLPLSGVRLQKATLDGREAFPDAVAADRLRIPVTGVGHHELILQFAVPVQSAGIDRDAKFNGPDLPVSRVGFAAGLRGRQLDVLSRKGGRSLRVGANGLAVDAEHGSGRTVHLHWRESGTAAGAKPTITAKEGAIWDLGEAESRLTAAWHYRIEGGTVGALKIEWPDHVLPNQISLESADGVTAGMGIRSWKVGPPANGVVTIDVRLQTPVEGQITLIAKGYSAKFPTPKPLLVFPRSADVADADRDSFHAVRLSGLKSEGIAVSGAIDFPAEAVAREFPTVAEFNFAKSPPARVVRRAGGKATELRPTLVPYPAYQPLAGEVSFTIGRRIEVEGAMRASAKDTGSVEFDVPNGLILHDVWAPGLAGWSRAGSRIQTWLVQPVADVIIRWSGHLPGVPAPDSVVDLLLPRWPSAVAKFAEPLAVRVRPVPGWSIQPIPVAGLNSKPSSVPEEWLMTPLSEQYPAAKFQVRHSPQSETAVERFKPSSPVAMPSATMPVTRVAGEVSEPSARDDGAPLRAALWVFVVGAMAALVWFRRAGARPEAFLLLGLCAVAVFGAESVLSIPFGMVAAFGLGSRVWRIARGLGRRALG